MIVKHVSEMYFFFTLNFSPQGRYPHVRARLCSMQQPKKNKASFWSCKVGCVHKKLVEVWPDRQNSEQKYKDFTHALASDKHAEWPQRNHNTLLLKSIGLFSTLELSFAAPRVLPVPLHPCGFIVSLLPVQGQGTCQFKAFVLRGFMCKELCFLCKTSNIWSSEVRYRLAFPFKDTVRLIRCSCELKRLTPSVVMREERHHDSILKKSLFLNLL